MTFATQLTKARKKAKLSKSELSRRTGIARGTIIRYESDRSTPEIENLGLLADALGVSTDMLLGRKSRKDKA